jgi:N-sulfoglucosamine sulfohydrolase
VAPRDGRSAEAGSSIGGTTVRRWLTSGGWLAALPLVALVAAVVSAEAQRQKPAPRSAATSQARARANILLVVADDWSWPHAGVAAQRVVSTPNIDRVAREGVTFTHAFTAAPSCTPARAAMLTGQYPHRLEEGGNLHGFLPRRFAVYPDLLAASGYHVGYTRKGWGPGRFDAGGRARNPAGPQFADFAAFLASRPAGAPFAFWFGTQDPHRPYERGSGVAAGLDPAGLPVPGFLPDRPDVRGDLADYLHEVQRLDRELGELLALLETGGVLDDTLVVVTSDNGMPFPRAKANVYDAGARVPLMMRWPGRVNRQLFSDAFVSTSDLAPTFLEVAGVERPAAMTGRSLLRLAAGGRETGRDMAFIERERHANVRRGDLSYPVRAVRTRRYLYARNFRPDRWPAGDPEVYVAVGPFGDIDGGPTKDLLLESRGEPAIATYFSDATAKRPAEELYDLETDPDQRTNVAGLPSYGQTRTQLRKALDRWMRETGDPRATRDDDRWDRYPYYGAGIRTAAPYMKMPAIGGR